MTEGKKIKVFNIIVGLYLLFSFVNIFMFIPIIYSEGSTIYEKWGEIKICIMSNECDTSKSNVKEGERIFFDVLPMLLAAGLLFAVSGRFLIADPNTRKAMANWTPHLQRAVRYVFFGLILVLISNLFDLDTMMTDWCGSEKVDTLVMLPWQRSERNPIFRTPGG